MIIKDAVTDHMAHAEGCHIVDVCFIFLKLPQILPLVTF